MNRKKYRQIWMILLLLLGGGSYFLFTEGQELNEKIGYAEGARAQLSRDLRSGNQLSADLRKLDSLTINEKDITALDVLRFINLEQQDLEINLGTPKQQRVGGTNLYERKITISGTRSYGEIMKYLDQFYNTQQLFLKSISLQKPRQRSDDGKLSMNLSVVIYGIEK